MIKILISLIMLIESGRSTDIRVENHLLLQSCPTEIVQKLYKAEGWRNHYTQIGGEFVFSHLSQEVEYRALAQAEFYCGDVAYQSTSFGSVQILGQHYELLGYTSAKELHQAILTDEETVIERFIHLQPGLEQAFLSCDVYTISQFWNPLNPDFYNKLYTLSRQYCSN